MILIALSVAILPNIKKRGLTDFILDRMGLARKERPDDIPEKIWNALKPPKIDDGGKSDKSDGVDAGGKWIGAIERFLSVLAAWIGEYEILIAWFAFKVASKWETWSNVVKLPDSLNSIDELDLLKARRQLGARLYDRFLVGSGINVGLGIFFGIIGKYFINLVS